MRVAIVADDLTGALDVCAPFAARGLICHVATGPTGLEAALRQDGDVVCVNTASREMGSGAAAALAGAVAERLAGAGPGIAFKKIDSRLKGHVAAETAACLAAFGRRRAIVAPAVPAQGRFVEAGLVLGKGLAVPLDIAEVLGGALPFEAPDGRTAADMEAIARLGGGEVLLVGASGLGDGLARVLGEPERRPPVSIAGPLLIAIGSHDPITLQQMERACALPGIDYHASADGRIGAVDIAAGVSLCRADSMPGAADHGEVLARFGASIAERLRGGDIATVLLCGGETAQTVLGALGLDCLELLGEALPGIAVTRAQLGSGELTILTKSGGFGTPDDLLLLAEAARKTMHPINANKAGTQA